MLLPLLCLTVLAPPKPLTDSLLLDEVQKRAVRFFVEKADPTTGLVCDRARLDGTNHPDVASIAATGYGLAALPIAVEHGWLPREQSLDQALRTLRFVDTKLPGTHGFYYHFIDRRTGERAGGTEVSTIDTALLVTGALVCGRYFGGEAADIANRVYDRMDWSWARTNGGPTPRSCS